MRTLEELDAAVTSLEERLGSLEITLGQTNTASTVLAGKLTALTARLNSVDGTGLAVPADSQLNQMKRQVAGITTTIQQVTLVLQTDMSLLKQDQDSLRTLVNQHLGA